MKTIRSFSKRNKDIFYLAFGIIASAGIICGIYYNFFYPPNIKEKPKAETTYKNAQDGQAPQQAMLVKHTSPAIARPSATKKEPTSTTPQSQRAASISAQNSNIVIGPNSGTIVQSIDAFPQPKFEVKPTILNAEEKGIFKSQILFTIDSKYPLKKLHLEAHEPSIISFNARQRNGFMSFTKGGVDGVIFIDIQNASGTYQLYVSTKQNETVNILHSYE
jgi:hypothetical protein